MTSRGRQQQQALGKRVQQLFRSTRGELMLGSCDTMSYPDVFASIWGKRNPDLYFLVRFHTDWRPCVSFPASIKGEKDFSTFIRGTAEGPHTAFPLLL